MSKKKRKISKKEQIKIEEIQVIEEPKIPFDAWFGQKVANKVLKPWQRLEISTFFGEKGLSEFEPISRYEDLLKIY